MPGFKDSAEADQVIGGFLRTFPRLDPIFKEVTDRAALTLKLELTAPELTAEIVLTAAPLEVRFDSDSEGTVAMIATAENFHRLLLGLLPPGVGINQKQLLVRGPVARLMKAVPLIYLAPYIYPFYLQAIGRSDLIAAGNRPPYHADRPLEGIMNTIISPFAFLTGWVLGFIKTRLAPGLDILAALEALGQGLRRATAKKTSPTETESGTP